MGFFDFLLEKANDKKATIFLALMHRVARSDGEVSDDEFTHIRNFTSSLNLTENQKIKLNKKLQNIPIEEAVQKSKKLSEEEKKELFDEMILVAKSDGLIDQNEINIIIHLAIQMGINKETINERLVNSNNLDVAEINLAIAKAKDGLEVKQGEIRNSRYLDAEKLKTIKRFKYIEDSLESVITDDFFDQINSSNFEDSEIILTHWLNDEDQPYAKLFMKEKIKFLTLNKIFEFHNILDLSFNISRAPEKSLREAFREGLNEILNPNTNSMKKPNITVSASVSYRKHNIKLEKNMKQLIIDQYEFFFGNQNIIEKLKELFGKYKHLTSRDFLFKEGRMLPKNIELDYLCYEPDKTPKVSMPVDKVTQNFLDELGVPESTVYVSGENENVITTKNKVLEEIKSIIFNASFK